MALAIAVVTLAACSSSDDASKYVADVTLPPTAEKTADADILVEAGANEFTLDIKTEGQWTVTSENRFLHVKNGSGTGNATVTVRVENNRSDDRKVGTLNIAFPGHESENKTLTVEQKYLGDYGGNAADVLDTSNSIYAVGYGYDCTGTYANQNSIRAEIFDTKQLSDNEVLTVSAVQGTLVEHTITGSSVNEMSNKLSAEASVEGSYCGFKGEVKASFNMEHASSNSYEYAISYLDLGVRTARLKNSFEAVKDEYMTDDAWNDINGVPVKNKRGIAKVRYPSTDEGFKSLIKAYGTHVVVSAGLGGRIRRSMEIDVTKISEAYDVNAFVKASYSGVVDASAQVDEAYKQSYQSNQKSISMNSDVLGGDESLAKTLATKEGFTKENLDAWRESVTGNNMTLVSFDKNSLVSILDLVERNATMENGGFDGKARYEALREYINKTMGTDPDFASYNCGTVVKFDVPNFGTAWNNTLVKDIKIDGQWVAQVCNEYIPAINTDERVTVIYPVITNQPRYNMGFFLGNNSHKPCRVSWSKDGVNIFEYSELDLRQYNTFYLRGASIKTEAFDGMEPKNGTASDEYLVAPRGSSSGNYPIVKIADKLWTRENYQGEHTGTITKSMEIAVSLDGKTVDRKCYFYFVADVMSGKLNPGAGWQVSSWDEFNSVLSYLERNKISSPMVKLFNGGTAGLELCAEGYMNLTYSVWFPSAQFHRYGFRDNQRIDISSNGSYSTDLWSGEGLGFNGYPVRLNSPLFP